MFQFGRFPFYTYFIQYRIHDSSSWVFPHSEICGSKLICSSPQLIAACHVLHRLPMPRHSPYALLRLNYLYVLILRIKHNCSHYRLNCCVSYFAVTWSRFFIRPWQNCLFYPLSLTKKPDFVLSISCFFPLLCLSCMSHRFFKNLYDFSYSVFNEHSLNFC